MPIAIRDATADDIHIYVDSWNQGFASLMRVWVAERNDALAGFVVLGYDCSPQ
jgi:hypothetical protein